MVSYKELKELYHDLKNDKVMKWTLTIFLIIAVIAFAWSAIVYIKDGNNGKHARLLWGFAERNIPKGYPDTVYIPAVKHDTIYLPPPPAIGNANSPRKNPGINQTNKDGKNEINENKGTNYGNIGGKDNTVNNFGIQPRIITEDFFAGFFKLVEHKGKNIELLFFSYGAADPEVINVRDQMIKIFKNHGYTNISPTFRTLIGFTPPDKIRIDTAVTQFHIYIPPAKL